MDMKVTGAYRNAAEYDGYAMSKESVAALKERLAEAKNNPQDYEKEKAAFYANDKVKDFLNKMSIKPAEQMESIGQKQFDDWFVKNGYAADNAIARMNSSEKAEVYLKAYTEIYDEIERGYADGTRIKYVIDPELEGDNKVRQMTKEEELAALDKEYEKAANRIKWQRRDEINSELIRQGKLETWDSRLNSKNRPKQSVNRGEYGKNTPEDVKEFVNARKNDTASKIQKEGEETFIDTIAQSMFQAIRLFKEQYGQSEPGTFDIAGFLKNVTTWK